MTTAPTAVPDAPIAPGAELVDFVRDLRWEQVPPRVRRHATLVLVDLVAATLPGRGAPTSRIAVEVADEIYRGTEAVGWYDGRRLSAPGAAFANAVMANALDFDDGHRLTKGHPGAIIIPAAVAVAQRTDATAAELMAAIVVGYEVGIRAGVLQHAQRSEYHSTGSWGAVGAAAASAHLLRLDAEQTRHALGLAEYHAPISLIMRSVDDPQMTKDGIGWGAHVGVTSALLAQRDFTAVQPELLADGDFATLGSTWAIEDVYLKPYPCCRWGQSAVAAALTLRDRGVEAEQVERVVVHTFAAAAALSRRRPTTTEEAQYNLVWPVASALAKGRYTVEDVLGGFDDPAVHAMADRVEVRVDPDLTAAFPSLRQARIEAVLTDGTVVDSGLLEADGEPGSARWEDVVAQKAASYLGRELAAGTPPPDVRLGALGLDELVEVLCHGTQ